VAAAAVVGVPHERIGEEVKAYLALKAGVAATEDELIAFARQRMRPTKGAQGRQNTARGGSRGLGFSY
jgi:long-chain acyl-CoA synthetase